MKFIEFKDITEDHKYLGGKAYKLGLLISAGFPVPNGAVLSSLPTLDEEWTFLFNWWNATLQNKPLAVRSSALGEDSDQYSFAGQNSTFLNINNKNDFKNAVKNCFDSIEQQSSRAYRSYFLDDDKLPPMNVVLQEMIDPLYSGVYFSIDPRGKADSWLLEIIDGLGEDLVSGKRTPTLIQESDKELINTLEGLSFYDLDHILENGQKVKEYLKHEVDMEWCIDKNNQFLILQARPVTAVHSHSHHKQILEKELSRLKKSYPENPTWDGKTFAEWTGFPSYLTFSLWRDAFAPNNSFGDALKKLGYMSFVNKSFSTKDSLLQRVFGRAYVNLDAMGPLYFGPIPYSINPRPRPHLVFDWNKINLKTILRTPQSIWRMISVGWNLSTNRKHWLDLCRKELATFKTKMDRPLSPDLYKDWSDQDILNLFDKECRHFSKQALYWPFILIILTESTMQSLERILKSVLGDSEATHKIKVWMGHGLKTTTAQMNHEFQKACVDPLKRPFFMSCYGHRGPGELDLSNPRWVELGDDAFYNISKDSITSDEDFYAQNNQVITEIEGLKSFKKSIILQEWKLLKSMLELREQWKMELLRPYAQIRFLAEEMGRRSELGLDIHWLRLSEIQKSKVINKENIDQKLRDKILDRKQRFNIFKLFSFPDVMNLEEISGILDGTHNNDTPSLDGEALSPGAVFGTVVVVKNIQSVKIEEWPEDAILVAESTDPGWTPLFTQAKAIVVEKGGVLSHCAIVAREMGLPAVSGIVQCHNRLKNGDKIWVDGNNGNISIESSRS